MQKGRLQNTPPALFASRIFGKEQPNLHASPPLLPVGNLHRHPPCLYGALKVANRTLAKTSRKSLQEPLLQKLRTEASAQYYTAWCCISENHSQRYWQMRFADQQRSLHSTHHQHHIEQLIYQHHCIIRIKSRQIIKDFLIEKKFP